MFNVGSVSARLGFDVDDSGADRWERRLHKVRAEARDDVEVPLKGDFDGRGFDRFDRKLHDAERDTHRSTGRMGGAMKGLGLAVASGAATGGVAAGYLGQKMLGMATDINESLSKNQVLFGDHAKGIARWSEGTAESIGVSRQAALEATGTFGNLFVALDIGPAKAADMSTSLVELAADMASFNNASPEEALEAIRSGLVGETEPLRKFGVNMNDATLRAQALKMGLIESTKDALDPQTKALAASALITKQTEKAHGDFARTSGGLANQQRILKARLADVGAEIGEKVLPFATKLVTGFNNLISGGSGAGDTLEKLTPILEAVGDWVERLANLSADAATRIWDAFSDVFGGSGIGRDLETIGKAILGFVEIVEDLYESVARRALPGIETAFRGLLTVIRGVIRVIAGILTGDFGKAWRGVKDIFGGGIRMILGVFRTGTAPIRDVASRIGGAVTDAFEKAWGKIEDITETMEGVVRGAFNGIREVVRFVIGKVIDGVDIFLGGLEAMARAASHLPFVGGKFKGVADAIAGARGRLQDLKTELDGTPGKASKIDPLLSKVKSLKNAFDGVAKAADDAFEAAARAVNEKPRKRAMGGRVGPDSGGPGLFIAGEGSKDEWVISQEGPKTANIGWAVEALETLTGREVALYRHGKGRGPNPTTRVLGPGQLRTEMDSRHLMKRIWEAAAPYLGGRMPPTSFTYGDDALFVGADQSGRVYWPDWFNDWFLGRNRNKKNAALETLIHEWAHTRQNVKRTNSVRLAEGGATAFSQIVAPEVYRSLGMPFDVVSTERGDPYGPMAKWVVRNKGRDWVLRGQFDARALLDAGISGHRRGKGSRGKTKGAKQRKRAGKATGAAGQAQRLVDYWEIQLDHGERDYGQLERGFDMTDEEFLVEDGNGNLVLNEPGIKARQGELGKLYAARKRIKEIAQKYAAAVRNAIDAARKAIKRLKAAIVATKVVGESGPRGQAARDAAAKRRQGYRDQIADYQAAIEDLGITGYEVGEAIEDYDLDLSGLTMEAAEVAGTTAPAADTGGGGGTGGDGGDTAAPEVSAPSAADIAAAAAEQLATFQAGRADLFRGFGSNVVAADRIGEAFATELGQAAGTAFFGAAEGAFGSGGGDTIVTQNITIAGTQTDELTFAQRAAGALKVAI